MAKRSTTSYSVLIAPAAIRDLKKLQGKKQILASIDAKIRSLAVTPRPTGSKKLIGSENSYRVRDGEFRILYEINDKERIIAVYRVQDRKDVYRH